MRVTRLTDAFGLPPEATFRGEVHVSGYHEREDPSRLRGATVRFAPGARTPWKTNPAGQTLVVLDGEGRAQVEGETVVEIRAGDVVWCPPGRRHWEGGSPTHGMTYVALHEVAVSFGEAVSDEEYADVPTAEGGALR